MKNALPGKVLVRCPGCGESLMADASYDETVCPFCGVRFRVSDGVRALGKQGAPTGERCAPPRRKRHVFRWLLLCLVCFLLGRAVLPGVLRGSGAGRRTETDRSLSAPAVTAAPRPASTERPSASPRPGATERPSASPRPGATAQPSAAPRNGAAAKDSEVTPEFRELMDSYEAFFDEYIAFLGSMDEEGDGFGFLFRYADMMSRYADMMDSLDAIEDESLSTADEIYYLEVLSRINRKLLEASAED